MNDLGQLQNRATHAVDQLRRSQHDRRQHSQSLGQVLNDLQIKFEARTSELDDCRDRIGQLEDSNRALSELLGEMIDIVERTAEDTSGDPVFRATATAKEIVTRYVGGNVANDDPARESRAAAPAAPVPAMTVAEAFGAADSRFEDVGKEFLFAEDMYERELGARRFPRLVVDAAAVARDGILDAGFEDDAPIEIPEPAAPVAAAEPEPRAQPGKSSATAKSDNDLDIKEIMARLEIAAERAQLRADADAGRIATIEPAMLDRAVAARG